jgi:4-alpha-glucanotransferase
MKFERASGILLHPSSLHGPFGIGDLGPTAYQWVDWLARSGCKLWQILPMGPTGYGNSPYQCFSAFAGNPYLISPELLLQDKLLDSDDLGGIQDIDPERVDYGRVISWKNNLLEKAFCLFSSESGTLQAEFDSFCKENSFWLDDYALFMAIKEEYRFGSWVDWPETLRQRDPVSLEKKRKALIASIERYSFYQFTFFQQWNALSEYAHKNGLSLIGDIPIFVAYDSSDVWSHPDLFHLNANLKPTVVAGVPPDYFSPTGQLWGNPLYRWEIHKESGYKWWLERLRAALRVQDILRIDHFRGFAGYWEIPAGNTTAEFGQWREGPGADFLDKIISGFNLVGNGSTNPPIIVEDLGFISPDVIALRNQFGLPGMKVLQFAFSGPENPFLPHSYPKNCVVYTGTHDNDTTLGWYESAPENEKQFARRYLDIDGSDIAWDLIRAAWKSPAVYALAPFQDFLGLDSKGRMNYPSRPGGNWEWRMRKADLSEELQGKIKELNWLYQR